MTLHTVCLCVAAVLGSATAFAGGFQLNELGSRAMAQGGAFAARASDPSAIYFNPAGLGFQSQAELYLGTTFIMPQVSFYGPVVDANDPAIKNETKMVSQTFTPIDLYATYPVTNDLHVGFGVMNPYGLGTEWPTDWVGKYLTTKVDLQAFYYTPTVAYKVSDKLSIGAGLSIVTGTVKLQQEENVINTDTQVEIDMTSKAAYGFTAGVLYKFTPDLSAGISYRSSVKMNASGSADFNPQFPVVNVVNDNVTSSITLPATGFAGLAYKASPNMEIEADYQYIGWSSYKQLAIDFTNNPANDVVAPKNYSDTYMIRIGGEYTMDALKIRAGYLYDHTPVASAYVDPLLPDANRNGVNVGLGYQFTKQISADVSYMFLKFDQRQAVNTVSNFDGTYNALANLIGVNVGYTF
jgi:long-chain fatty acid transport protein